MNYENNYQDDNNINNYIKKHISINKIMQNRYNLVPLRETHSYDNVKYLCPVHNEKTPSFNIFVNKRTKVENYKCHGCGASGDVFTLVQEVENIGFFEAKKILLDFLLNITTSDSSSSSSSSPTTTFFYICKKRSNNNNETK